MSTVEPRPGRSIAAVGLFCASILLASATSATAQPAVLGGPIPFDGNDYYILDQSDWFDANAAAEAMGGYLVTLQSQAESDFLVATFGAWGGTNRAFWIGLNDAQYELYFQYANGHPLTYTNWAGPEPLMSAAEDHVSLKRPSYDWDVIPGSSTSVCCAVMDSLHGIVEVGPRQGGFLTDEGQFRRAVGEANLSSEDFQSIPLNMDGYAVFDNGDVIGTLTIDALSSGGFVQPLEGQGGSFPTGLVGATLATASGPDIRLEPGGGGLSGTAEDDDDFAVTFDQPASATGIWILDNRTEASEAIEFRDEFDALIGSFELPGCSTGSGCDAFAGYVTAGGDAKIKSIRVLEGAPVSPLDDDIGYDDVLWGDIDSDFDGISDNDDNCPEQFNPTQEDDDADGVGDFCDNCPSTSNPGQENTGGFPDVGDVCTPALVVLRRDSMAIDPTFDLELACGGLAISEINIGMRLPFGVVPSTAVFGGGCDEPVVPPAIGVPAGTGCTANPDLGSTIDAPNSGAYGPGLSAPFGSETVYVQLRGNGTSGQLCDPYSPFVLLGRFVTGPSSTFSGASALIGAGIRASGLEFALDTGAQPAPLGQRTSGAGDPDLEILLQPAAGEDEATATRWSLCISEFTDQRMHRISAGLRVIGATDSDIRVLGCDPTPDMSGVRDCDADSPDVSVGPTVDDARSFTMGPFASPIAPTVDDTMYVVVEGSAQAPGATTLNPTQFQQWCVATIEVDAPPGVAGVPPEFVTDGLGLLPYSDANPDPWQTSSTLLDPLSLEQVALDNGFNSGDDLDGDGVLDSADNCRFVANVDSATGELANNGDFQLAGVDLDEDGDACECGDGNGSGAVFGSGTPDPAGSPLTPDLDVIRAYLVGNNTDPEVGAKCSVHEGDECDTKDAVVLQRALNAQAPGVQPRCDAALPD